MWSVGKSAQEHYKNFHKKFNSWPRVFTLSKQKLLSMSEQAYNLCICQEDFCWVGVSWKHLLKGVFCWSFNDTNYNLHFMFPAIGLLLPCAGQHLLELYRHVSSIWRTILGCQNKIMCICSTEGQGLEIFLNSSIWLHWQTHFPSLHQPVKGQQIHELQTLILAHRKSHVGLPAWLQRAVLHRGGAAAQVEPPPSNKTCGSTWDMLGWASKPLVATAQEGKLLPHLLQQQES